MQRMWCAARCSTVLAIAIVSAACLFGAVENKSICGIGMRVAGDQLLVKDVLESRSAGIGRNQKIFFNYDIPEPITHIRIESMENIHAQVILINEEDLVKGYVTAPNNSPSSSGTPFTISIAIYGINETMSEPNPSFFLNKNEHFKLRIEPEPVDIERDDDDDADDDKAEEVVDNQAGTDSESTGTPLDTSDYDYDDEDEEEGGEALIEVEDGDEEESAELTDAIIEEGKRQKGDYLLYQTEMIYSTVSSGESKPTVVFYYIDSNYITYVQFSVIDYYANNWSGGNSKAPSVEYSYLSDNSLKAVLIDNQVPLMFAKMSIYGYKPEDLPVDYVSFLANIAGHNVRVGTAGQHTFVTTESNLEFLRSRLNKNFMTSAAGQSSADVVAGDMNAALSFNGNNNVQCPTSGVRGSATMSTILYTVSIFVTSLMLIFARY